YLSRFECTYEEVETHAADADAIIGWAIPDGILAQAKNLGLFVWLHSGIDDIDRALLASRGVSVANVRGANAVAVAEQAMMFVLSLAKQTVAKHQAARESRKLYPTWADEHRSAMLDGRT